MEISDTESKGFIRTGPTLFDDIVIDSAEFGGDFLEEMQTNICRSLEILVFSTTDHALCYTGSTGGCIGLIVERYLTILTFVAVEAVAVVPCD